MYTVIVNECVHSVKLLQASFGEIGNSSSSLEGSAGHQAQRGLLHQEGVAGGTSFGRHKHYVTLEQTIP